MIKFLRRRQPRHLALAALYWVAIFVVVLTVLFIAFYFLDDYLPGSGQF